MLLSKLNVPVPEMVSGVAQLSFGGRMTGKTLRLPVPKPAVEKEPTWKV